MKNLKFTNVGIFLVIVLCFILLFYRNKKIFLLENLKF